METLPLLSLLWIFDPSSIVWIYIQIRPYQLAPLLPGNVVEGAQPWRIQIEPKANATVFFFGDPLPAMMLLLKAKPKA